MGSNLSETLERTMRVHWTATGYQSTGAQYIFIHSNLPVYLHIATAILRLKPRPIPEEGSTRLDGNPANGLSGKMFPLPRILIPSTDCHPKHRVYGTFCHRRCSRTVTDASPYRWLANLEYL